MAVIFSSISGTTFSFWSISEASYPARLGHGCQLFKHLRNTCPARLRAFKNLGHPILHGCGLFNHLWNNLSLAQPWALEASLGHPSCMAVTWLWTFQTSLEYLSCMAVNSSKTWDILSCTAVSFTSMSGASYLAWLSHGCELFNHLWNVDPAWLWPFQTSLGHPILHGCQLCKHVWDIVSCMAVSFANITGTTLGFWGISGAYYLAWLWHGCELFKHLWHTYPDWLWASQPSLELPDIVSSMPVRFATVSGTTLTL